jgi:hypothetical protein
MPSAPTRRGLQNVWLLVVTPWKLKRNCPGPDLPYQNNLRTERSWRNLGLRHACAAYCRQDYLTPDFTPVLRRIGEKSEPDRRRLDSTGAVAEFLPSHRKTAL